MIAVVCLLATFQIIKKLLPAKAVDRLRNINSKNISEYIDEDNMLKSWGGKDDYVFKFIPESQQTKLEPLELQLTHSSNGAANGFLSKKVCFHVLLASSNINTVCSFVGI